MIRLARTAIRYEIGLWRSFVRWVIRRPDVPRDGAAFGYAGPVTPVLAAFIFVSVIEIPIADFLLPWESVRIAFLVLGGYGVFWMFGLLASLRVIPHVVDSGGLRIRYSISVDITVPWKAVRQVRVHVRGTDGVRSGKANVTTEGSRRILLIPVMSTTNVDLILRSPTELRLRDGQAETVSEVRFWADDPRQLVQRAQEHLVPEELSPAG